MIVYTYTGATSTVTLRRLSGVVLGKVAGSILQLGLAVKCPGRRNEGRRAEGTERPSTASDQAQAEHWRLGLGEGSPGKKSRPSPHGPVVPCGAWMDGFGFSWGSGGFLCEFNDKKSTMRRLQVETA